MQLQDSIAGQSYAPSLGRNSSDSQRAADAEPSTGTGSSATYRSRTWSSVQHVNGVAVSQKCLVSKGRWFLGGLHDRQHALRISVMNET